MSKFHQILYFACYALAAGAIAFAGPRIFPAVPPAVAWLAGLVVFLAGALLHEIAVRRYNNTRDLHRLVLLHRAYNRANDDLEQLNREVADLRMRLEQGGAGGPGRPVAAAMAQDAADRGTPPLDGASGSSEPPPDIAEDGALAAEVKVLHGLVQRLYGPTLHDRLRPGTSAETDAGVGGGGHGSFADSHIPATESYERRELLDGVRDALRQNRTELLLQPIVTLPQRKQRYFDCSLQLKSRRGEIMPAAKYADILQDSGLDLAVGNMVLFRTIQAIRTAYQRDGSTGFCCAVSPASFADRAFFHDLITYLDSCDDLPANLILAFSESAPADIDEGAMDDVEHLIDAGFSLCLNRPRHLEVDAQALTALGFHMVKLDAQELMPRILHDDDAGRVRQMKRALDDAGIELIVDNIESEQMLVELLDFDIDFGQGALFGAAAAGDALAEPAAREGAG